MPADAPVIRATPLGEGLLIVFLRLERLLSEPVKRNYACSPNFQMSYTPRFRTRDGPHAGPGVCRTPSTCRHRLCLSRSNRSTCDDKPRMPVCASHAVDGSEVFHFSISTSARNAGDMCRLG